MDRIELAAWLRLLLTPGIGNASARKLLTAFGLPATVFAQNEALLATRVSRTQSQALLHEPPELADLLQRTWDWLQAAPDCRRILSLGDPLYPKSLLQTEDPPLLLYAMGPDWVWSQDLLNAAAPRCLAIVGSRNPSPQGAANARQFARALAEQHLCIVSGMALGVDGAAHAGAVAGAPAGTLATIAVVGTGLDRVYPGQHRELAQQIAQRGVLLSELAVGTAPHAANFPQRNRIISGLSRGTLVVEAALHSGSLITARLASEQGREVFAIPGSIHAAQSRGCHALLKQGAKLVECAQDVLDELQWGAPQTGGTAAGATAARQAEQPPAEESALLQALGHDPAGVDALQARTGLPTPALLAELMALELQGDVARLPGGLFLRVARA
jgi:DNA processing protein